MRHTHFQAAYIATSVTFPLDRFIHIFLVLLNSLARDSSYILFYCSLPLVNTDIHSRVLQTAHDQCHLKAYQGLIMSFICQEQGAKLSQSCSYINFRRGEEFEKL